MDTIHTIKEKLEALRRLDKGCAVFGASQHRYQFGPTLRDFSIAGLENKHDLTLSEEYKTILQHLGDGGAGPGYGLQSISMKHIHPPYVGHQHLLRNWDDPKVIDIEMIDSEEISGYIKLFDFGCGMETCLIVKGENVGDLIFFDCDDRFQVEEQSLLEIYSSWLDSNLAILRRVEEKLHRLPLQEVVDSEWELKNFSVKQIILSLMGSQPLRGGHSGNQLKAHLEQEYQKWKANT